MPEGSLRDDHLDREGVAFNPVSIFVGEHLVKVFDTRSRGCDPYNTVRLLLAYSEPLGRAFIAAQDSRVAF
ncbi:MAG: hypothetical protein ACOCTG_06505 [Bacteroidota bacterium]